MCRVQALVSQYKHSPRGAVPARQPNEAKVTQYWIKHKLNSLEMSQLLFDRALSFADRADLTQAIAAAERKVNYWERQGNFNLNHAQTVFRAAKRAQKTS